MSDCKNCNVNIKCVEPTFMKVGGKQVLFSGLPMGQNPKVVWYSGAKALKARKIWQ